MKPMNAQVLSVQGLSGATGYLSEVTYTVVLHADTGDLIYEGVVPCGRPPYDLEIHPAPPGTPAIPSWAGSVVQFSIVEWPDIAGCP